MVDNLRYLLSLGQKEWPNYFPHVGSRALEFGFYDVIDRMQGHRGAYFVGSSLTFEKVEHAARQAKSVILEHFGSSATGGRKELGRCSAPLG